MNAVQTWFKRHSRWVIELLMNDLCPKAERTNTKRCSVLTGLTKVFPLRRHETFSALESFVCFSFRRWKSLKINENPIISWKFHLQPKSPCVYRSLKNQTPIKWCKRFKPLKASMGTLLPLERLPKILFS